MRSLRFVKKNKRRDLPLQNTFIRAVLLSLRLTSFDCDSTTRAHVRLLGPCFKTGRVRPDFYSPLWFTDVTTKVRANDRSRPGRTAQRLCTQQEAKAKAPTNSLEIRVPYNSTPSRSRSPTRSPTCSRRPPRKTQHHSVSRKRSERQKCPTVAQRERGHFSTFEGSPV